MKEQDIEKLIEATSAHNRATLDHVRALASTHAAVDEVWCSRQRRRDSLWRTIASACILCVVIAGTYTANVQLTQYSRIDSNYAADNTAVCQSITQILLQS